MIFVVAYGLKILFKNHLNYNFYSVITFSIRKIYIYNTEEYLEPSQTCKVSDKTAPSQMFDWVLNRPP